MAARKNDEDDQKAEKKAQEEIWSESLKKLEAVLKEVPPEKLAQARKEVEDLLKGDMSWADLTQYTPERLMQIAELGYNQFKLGFYDKAERIFKSLTIIDPDNYYYHQMLGATFQRQEKFADSLVEYSVAVDLNPQDTVSYTNRGEVYFKLGMMELAAVDFDRAIALDLKGDDKWANRARMLREQVKIVEQRKKK